MSYAIAEKRLTDADVRLYGILDDDTKKFYTFFSSDQDVEPEVVNTYLKHLLEDLNSGDVSIYAFFESTLPGIVAVI